MGLREFPRTGHLPTLLCAFLYFTISCMVWMMIGALANSIIPDLGQLSDSQKGLLVAVPVLGGALLRLVLGPLTDYIGAKKTALIGLTLTLVPLLMGWLCSDSYLEVLLVGLVLGVAGASLAAALPLASRWYPPQDQGLVLGIAGAGNVGTALSTFFGPWVASFWGWHAAFGIALVPVLATLALVAFLAQDRPTRAAPKTLADYAALLKIADTGWFCFFFAITFGGFVGLVSFLAILFRDQYALTTVQAGAFATICALTGSMIRPLGGYLSDRFGGIRVLTWLYLGVAATMAGVSSLPALGPCTLLLVTGMTLLGMGNGAVFQLVAQRFPKEIGVITGLVGAAGGLGGFVLPNALGSLRQLTQSYGGGFLAFALVGASGAVALFFVGRTWEGTFLGKGGVVAVRPTPGRVGTPKGSEGRCGADLVLGFSSNVETGNKPKIRSDTELLAPLGGEDSPVRGAFAVECAQELEVPTPFRDPAVFADPEHFDIHRQNAREYFSFGHGAHYCLGAPGGARGAGGTGRAFPTCAWCRGRRCVSSPTPRFADRSRSLSSGKPDRDRVLSLRWKA